MRIGIRADGGPTIGMGHLVRATTLARELEARGTAVELLTELPGEIDALDESVATTSVAGHDVSSYLEANIDLLVLDLPFESRDSTTMLDTLSLQRRLSDSVEDLVLFDDAIDRTVHCDVLVNGHLYADRDRYTWTGEQPELLLGSSYHIVDPEVRSIAANPPGPRDDPERLLVTMGGSDVSDTTPTALRALGGLGLHIDVIIGPGFSEQNLSDIEDVAQHLTDPVTLHRNPDNFGAVLASADLAVSALGFTAYELLAVGTPVVGVVIAPDQSVKATAFSRLDAACVLDGDVTTQSIRAEVEALLESPTRRRDLRERGMELVDGNGLDRVCDAIEARL